MLLARNVQELAVRKPLRPHYVRLLISKAEKEAKVIEIHKFATELNKVIDMAFP